MRRSQTRRYSQANVISGGQGKIDAAAFFQLGRDGALAFGGECGSAAIEETPQAFGIQDGHRTLAFRLDPPSGQDEHRSHWHGTTVQGSEFSGKPIGIALGLIESVAVCRHGRGETELLAIKDDFVTLLSIGSVAAGFSAGLGFDGEDTGGRDNNVVDVPSLATRFPDFHVVKHPDGIRRELIEDLTDDLFSQKTEAVIHKAADGS